MSSRRELTPDAVLTAISDGSALATTIPALGPGGANPDFQATHAGAARAQPLPDASARTAGRTTVLPRLEGATSGVPRLVAEERPRYHPMRVLGRGGMGEVSLEVDRDIGRSVAIKRLLPQVAGDAGVARFVDEVRVMGRLEHPNIVPVHDVGVDDEGRYYFVMKHVEGETLEAIIEKLRAGDRETLERFSTEAKVEVFLGLLRALQFAHDRGFVHRDVKPANVMVGRFGEVMLMDWGIAKPIGNKANELAPPGAPEAGGAADLVWAGALPSAGDARLSATHLGQLIGTPAYMSPEQARGRNDLVDARSDLYSATVVFRELLSLRHYLADAKTLEEVLAGVVVPHPVMVGMRHTEEMPTELAHFVDRSMALDPAKRFASAGDMIRALQNMLEGRVHVQCAATLTKRMTREAGRYVDRHPMRAFMGMVAGAGAVLAAAITLALSALR